MHLSHGFVFGRLSQFARGAGDARCGVRDAGGAGRGHVPRRDQAGDNPHSHLPGGWRPRYRAAGNCVVRSGSKLSRCDYHDYSTPFTMFANGISFFLLLTRSCLLQARDLNVEIRIDGTALLLAELLIARLSCSSVMS